MSAWIFVQKGMEIAICIQPRENNGTERETPGIGLGMCELRLSYF